MNEEAMQEIKKILLDHEKRISNLEKPSISGKKIIANTKTTIIGRLSYLKQEGFFDQPKFLPEIIIRFAEEGYHYPPSSLTAPLQRAVRQRLLGRLKKDNKWGYVKR
ncbi:MAG: hypothetical protein PHG36_06110 [Dehalococcoidia bacterium]|nr:hypothetical protein [Dehalococcoidia bacterium]